MSSTVEPSPAAPVRGTMSAQDMDNLRRIDVVLARFQKLSPTLGIGQIRAIIWAAIEGGKGYQSDFVEKLGLSETAASGNLDYWTKWCKNKHKPVELLSKEQAIENRTLNRVYLTQEGEQFVNKIISILNPANPIPKEKE